MFITIIIFALFAVAAILGLMALSPGFKEMVVVRWGWLGAALLGILTWIGSWFADAGPTLPM